MSNREAAEGTPVIKLGLKRVPLDERVLGDDELRGANFIRQLGEDSVRSLLSQATGKRFPDQGRIFVEGEPGSNRCVTSWGRPSSPSVTGPAKLLRRMVTVVVSLVPRAIDKVEGVTSSE